MYELLQVTLEKKCVKKFTDTFFIQGGKNSKSQTGVKLLS